MWLQALSAIYQTLDGTRLNGLQREKIAYIHTYYLPSSTEPLTRVGTDLVQPSGSTSRQPIRGRPPTKARSDHCSPRWGCRWSKGGRPEAIRQPPLWLEGSPTGHQRPGLLLTCQAPLVPPGCNGGKTSVGNCTRIGSIGSYQWTRPVLKRPHLA